MKILILGAPGMLGLSFVKLFSADRNIDLYCSTTSQKKKIFLKKKFLLKSNKILVFQIKMPNIYKIIKLINNMKFDIIINCIGVIKPHINEENNKSVINALVINSLFPQELSKISNNKLKIFQIATDCVFNGSSKLYDENSNHDAIDIYGKSKSLGESKRSYFYNLRCSIIGLERYNNLSLVEWFLSQKSKANLKGFTNHYWNGVSTDVFAELVKTIIFKKIKIPNNLNIIPKNIVSKYDLLILMRKKFKKSDLLISKFKSSVTINRTLKTNFKKINNSIWKNSKFKKILSIQEIVEYI